MKHKVTKLDVVTDLKRSISASFSKEGFNDTNAKEFLEKAQTNLKEIDLSKSSYSQVVSRLKKANDSGESMEKRREDVLMASSLVI
jgi:hypothetical protein